MTNGVDMVVVLRAENIAQIGTAFPDSEFYCPPREILRIEQARSQRGHFNLLHHATGFKADIYLAGSDPLHAWGLARRRMAKAGEEDVSFAPPEYVIVRKLQFYREGSSAKHLRDIHRMVHVLGAGWDRQDLLGLIQDYGLAPEWEAAQHCLDGLH